VKVKIESSRLLTFEGATSSDIDGVYVSGGIGNYTDSNITDHLHVSNTSESEIRVIL